jgi:hypothetical protein
MDGVSFFFSNRHARNTIYLKSMLRLSPSLRLGAPNGAFFQVFLLEFHTNFSSLPHVPQAQHPLKLPT